MNFRRFFYKIVGLVFGPVVFFLLWREEVQAKIGPGRIAALRREDLSLYEKHFAASTGMMIGLLGDDFDLSKQMVDENALAEQVKDLMDADPTATHSTIHRFSEYDIALARVQLLVFLLAHKNKSWLPESLLALRRDLKEIG